MISQRIASVALGIVALSATAATAAPNHPPATGCPKTVCADFAITSKKLDCVQAASGEVCRLTVRFQGTGSSSLIPAGTAGELRTQGSISSCSTTIIRGGNTNAVLPCGTPATTVPVATWDGLTTHKAQSSGEVHTSSKPFLLGQADCALTRFTFKGSAEASSLVPTTKVVLESMTASEEHQYWVMFCI
ncbi:MAG: hypothetical protein NVSMB57_05420 [Actinomycetota bacterium]